VKGAKRRKAAFSKQFLFGGFEIYARQKSLIAIGTETE